MSEAAVEAAAKALYEVEWRESLGGRPWDLAGDDERPYWRASARAALEAALPLLVAGEREKLFRFLMYQYAGWRQSDGDDSPGVIALGNAVHFAFPEYRDEAQTLAAAAIRAGKGGE